MAPSDGETACLEIFQLLDFPVQIFFQVLHFPDGFQIKDTGWGQLYRAPVPDEQRHADPGFDLPQGDAQGRLGDKQFFCGPGKTAFPINGVDVFIVGIHGIHLFL